MNSYIPVNQTERDEMLQATCLEKEEDLFQNINHRCSRLNLPEGLSELEVSRLLTNFAEKNIQFKSIYRGAGAYNHYIPSIVNNITAKEEFLTAYTPYQAEISQGILQSIFEFQTLLCELTGLDAANASVYDGATAAAESIAMCVERKRTRMLVSSAVNPNTIQTMMTYAKGTGVQLDLLPSADGLTDIEALNNMLDESVAGVLIQSPNFYGLIENSQKTGEIVHSKGARFVTSVNPLSLSILKTPGENGADIAVGDAQPLGMALSFGGPYLGFMTTTTSLQRKLPGRIAGETTDIDSKRAFVLTLQAREQHIRREKASSNICSNQALCAMRAAVYLAAVGKEGQSKVAQQCYSKAHYAASKFASTDGFTLRYKGDFFNEFVTECPVPSELLLKKLEATGILGGYPVENNGILWCFTEMNPKDEIDRLIGLCASTTI